MFWNIATLFLWFSIFAPSAICSPIARTASRSSRTRTVSFNNWRGFKSLHDFDNFYGFENFNGHHYDQVFVKDEHQLVCRPQEVKIVQQRMLALQEMAKRIVTELVCDVETQTIVWEQYFGGIHNFGHDLRRLGPFQHQVGFDRHISNHYDKIVNHDDGSLSYDDWGFTGHDLGHETVVVKGHNWDEERSPRSVGDAWKASRDAWN